MSSFFNNLNGLGTPFNPLITSLGIEGTDVDLFGQQIATSRIPQIQLAFFQAAPASLPLTITNTGGAYTGSGLVGGPSGSGLMDGYFATGTAATAECKAVTIGNVGYAAHCEVWSAFTCQFTNPTSANSYQRIGLYNASDGFSVGYSGTTFGLWFRTSVSGSMVDTFIAQSNWNEDVCSGQVGSSFTKNNQPIALNPNEMGLYRIRFGWLGIAAVVYEIMDNDGNFVVVHELEFPNSQITPSITTPNLPLTVDGYKNSADATNLIMSCGCFVAGITSAISSYLSGNGSISINGGSFIIPVTGTTSMTFTISGSFTGVNMSFSYSTDGGTFQTDNNVVNCSNNTFTSTTQSTGTFRTNFSGAKFYKFACGTLSSGTVNISYALGQGTNTMLVTEPSIGITNPATAIPSSAMMVGGSDGTYLRPFAVKNSTIAAATTDPALVVSLSPNSPIVGTYNTTAQSLTNGQTGSIQLDGYSNLDTTLATQIFGENSSINRMMVASCWNYSYFSSTQTGVALKTSAGVLGRILITQITSGTLAIYDSATTTSNEIFSTSFPATLLGSGPISLDFQCNFSNGLWLVTTNSLVCTILWI